MVMEPLPAPAGAAGGTRGIDSSSQLNPHFLGREFVRQYYTLLNQAPHSLHRFYSEDSSLVHGSLSRNGENDPVYGQPEIQNRIMSLNFRDCHAKIRQVDSLETLQRGVVVQVTGELSNNGEPMRRFFQTFVLAPRSPTNYYVRNDIFRYQDEVFVDEEECGEIEKPDLDLAAKAVIEATLSAPEPVLDSQKQVNGHPEAKPLLTPEPVLAAEPLPVAPVVAASVRAESQAPPKQQEAVSITGPAAKLSWASRVADSVVAPVPVLAHRPVEVPAVQQTSPIAAAAAGPAVALATLPKVAKDPRRGNRGKVKPEKPEAPVAVAAEGTESLTDERKAAVSYGDEQQVFVGNLPQDISEDELRKFFSKYGNIVDVRINRTNQKSGSGRTPNYGFVTFEDTKIVKSILSQKPIYFNEHRFNVEEKRSQGRGNNLNRSGSGGGLSVGRDRGGNLSGEAKNNRPPRGDRKDGPRERPFGDRNERLSGDSNNSGHMGRKPGGVPAGRDGPPASGAGNSGVSPAGGQQAGPPRQSFNNKR